VVTPPDCGGLKEWLMSTKFKLAFVAISAVTMLANTGCFWIAGEGPNLGPFSIPIPVSPYFQDQEEYEFHMEERYEKVPILGPLTAGGPAQAIDPPSDDEVMRALERARPIRGGVPFLYEKNRNNVRIVKYKIADYVDPPRVYPLIGPAQLHHAHYKCVIYFEETTNVGWPVPHQLRNEEAQEVVYVDHNHFHMVGDLSYGPGSGY
jgi:hypothetical protein